MRIRIKDAELYVGMSARWPWTKIELSRSYHHYSGYRAMTFVWGKFIISLDYTRYTRELTLCGYCNEPVSRVGEDALDWCESCQCVEGNTYSELEYVYEQK
jgi:hypothetical protein